MLPRGYSVCRQSASGKEKSGVGVIFCIIGILVLCVHILINVSLTPISNALYYFQSLKFSGKVFLNMELCRFSLTEDFECDSFSEVSEYSFLPEYF